MDIHCTRCGKKHLGSFVFLEFNSVTGHYATPGRVPEGESQGLFRFGKTCAKRALAHERLADHAAEDPEAYAHVREAAEHIVALEQALREARAYLVAQAERDEKTHAYATVMGMVNDAGESNMTKLITEKTELLARVDAALKG